MARTGHRQRGIGPECLAVGASGLFRSWAERGETVFVRDEKIYAADNIGQLHGLRQVILSLL